ncbi:MAG: glycogen/starch/alpha-glucan phosphorylase [Steroidobacterales bacterium]
MSTAVGKPRVRQGAMAQATPADDLHAAYRRHLSFDVVVDAGTADDRQRFEALALAIRDRLAEKWLATDRAYSRTDPKRVYYLSLEYLPGRVLASHIASLGLADEVARLVALEGLDLEAVAATEPDPALGNGGLGRLAACYLDSLATLAIPAMGYGLRYQYGIFRQEIVDGRQVERPDNWLLRSDPWEVARYPQPVETRIHCAYDFELGLTSPPVRRAVTLRGIPYDRPVVGYGARTINTLRLWGANTPDYFDIDEFNHGDFFGAVHDKLLAENITRVLYPSDSTSAGHHLRFLQEYFLVACSLADIVRRFRADNRAWHALPDKVAIQLNDTHPALAVAELMRLLLDEALLGWDESWDITSRTLAYTNHTLLPEAFERWPVSLFEMALPRHLEIIYEINRRFLDEVRRRWPGDEGRVQRVSLIEEGAVKQVRMAHLAVVGSHSTNGVSEIHTALLRGRTMKDLAELFPRRFNNKTNGVTPRRWLLDANPPLSALITEAIGERWITDAGELRRLAPFAGDVVFRDHFIAARRAAKERLAAWVSRSLGQSLDPASMFDSQIKRIHEYKRQLLSVLRIIVLYERLRQSPNMAFTPRTFLFAGKAAPDYRIAKLIILLINRVAEVIDRDPGARGRIKVLFLPDYGVTLAERLIPATDVSEQISTAGFEASGTGNMKLMMNGALTVGTRDGATLEMAQRTGEDNIFLFGLTADEVQGSRGWYDPRWHYAHEPETRAALDLVGSDHFSGQEPGVFAPILDALLRGGDYYMHLADLRSYLQTQATVEALYEDRHAWARRAILNVASSGWFSSDRAIAQYASEIWNVGASPVAA